jgi:hypothetical protein
MGSEHNLKPENLSAFRGQIKRACARPIVSPAPIAPATFAHCGKILRQPPANEPKISPKIAQNYSTHGVKQMHAQATENNQSRYTLLDTLRAFARTSFFEAAATVNPRPGPGSGLVSMPGGFASGAGSGD